MTWINHNGKRYGGTAKPLGSAGFPAPQRRAIYGLFLHHAIAPQTAWLRGTREFSTAHFHKHKTTNRDVASPGRHQETLLFERFCCFRKNLLFANFSGFLKALCYKGFIGSVFVKLLSQHRKHQKEELLGRPAAASAANQPRRWADSPALLSAREFDAGLRRELAHRQTRYGFQYRFCVRNRVVLKGCEVSPSICRLCVLTKRQP